MATRYFRAGLSLAEVGTTRYLTINSSLATQIILSSGYTAMSLFNQGSTSLVWGDSSIAINSGNYLFPKGRLEWRDLQDNFSVYLISDSNGTFGIANVTEYR